MSSSVGRTSRNKTPRSSRPPGLAEHNEERNGSASIRAAHALVHQDPTNKTRGRRGMQEEVDDPHAMAATGGTQRGAGRTSQSSGHHLYHAEQSAPSSRVGAFAVSGVDVDNIPMSASSDNDSWTDMSEGGGIGGNANDASSNGHARIGTSRATNNSGTADTATVVAEAVTNEDMANEIREQLRSEIRQELQAQLQTQNIVTAQVVSANVFESSTTTTTPTITTPTTTSNQSPNQNDKNDRKGMSEEVNKKRRRRRLFLATIPLLLIVGAGAAIGALFATGVLGGSGGENNANAAAGQEHGSGPLVGDGGGGEPTIPPSSSFSPPTTRPSLRPTLAQGNGGEPTTAPDNGENSESLLLSPQTIQGDNGGDQFGDFVVISRDGSTMAVGASEGNYVQVFRRSNNGDTASSWTRIGQTITGDGGGDQFGRSVDLNSDGSVLIVGAWNNDDAAEKAGHAKVYRYNSASGSNSWEKVGQTLTGDASMDRFGWYVSVSDDGNTVAVSARLGDPSSNRVDAGYVRIFTNNGSTSWTQLGTDLEGEAFEDQFGRSLALDGAGQRLAVGAVHGGGGTGRVVVFEWSNGSWNWVGQSLDGDSQEDWQGTSVALSQDGTMVAIGADGTDVFGSNSGIVRVYEDVGNSWVQRGNDILGEASGDQFGAGHISLSSDGRCLAVGANHNDNDRGRGYLYKWNVVTMDWSMAAQANGDDTGDRFGDSSAVSGDCQWVAWGAYKAGSSQSGSVSVYQVG